MSTLQFYIRDANGNHHETIDPVKTLGENDTQWIVYNGWFVYEIDKSEYVGCEACVRLTPPGDDPLWRMKDHLDAIGSSVKIDW